MLNGWMRKKCCPCAKLKGAGQNRLPLCEASTGKRFKVACIDGGRKLCARMAALGIYPGVEMELLGAGCGCPCMVRVHGSTLSLGAGVSDKILVTAS